MISSIAERPRVAAIVTAFRPGDALRTAVASLCDQVTDVVVVDDGSGPEFDGVFRSVKAPRVQVVRNATNAGVGAALESGRETLASADTQPDAILTLDQDSVAPPGLVDHLIDAWRAAVGDGVDVGMISPGRVESVSRSRPGDTSDARYAIGSEPIQSGLLIPSSTFGRIGGFRSSLFIDLVDTDFYLRARGAGLVNVTAPAAHLAHQLGTSHAVSLAGRDIHVTVASGFRYYFQARNVVLVAREHARSHPVRIASVIGRHIRHLAMVTALVPGRARRLSETWNGLRDGLRGLEGPRPARAEQPLGGTARPRVSVCMATWNGKDFVRDQVVSILDQLAPDDELVVVDDASSDGTPEVIAAFRDVRIRLIAEPSNRGYVRTFEHAMRAATGEILVLSDQDDIWLPGRLSVMLDAMASSGADVLASNLTTLGGPENIRGPWGQADWRLHSETSNHHVRNILGILVGAMPYYGCAMAVRRRALDRGLLPIPRFVTESHDLWIALWGNVNGSVVHIDERTLERRYHDSNQTPNRPRGPRAVVRSRAMLVRAIGVLLAKRGRGGNLSAPSSPAAIAPQV